MSWKPALIAALVVVVAGFGVGVAVDRAGGDGAQIVTRTVASGRTVTVTVPAQPGGGTGTGDSTTTTPDPAGRTTYLSELTDDATTSELTVGTPATVTVGHRTLEDNVTVEELWDFSCDTPAYIELSTPSDRTTFVADLGWTQDSDSAAAARFELHENTLEGRVLYQHTFDKPADPVHANVALPGAFKALLVWRRTDTEDCDTPDATFAMGNVRFIG